MNLYLTDFIWKVNFCEKQKWEGIGAFFAWQHSELQNLESQIFCRLWHGSLVWAKEKVQLDDNVFYYQDSCTFLFCEFGESAISSEQKIKTLRFCYERKVARKMPRYPLTSSVKQLQHTLYFLHNQQFISSLDSVTFHFI